MSVHKYPGLFNSDYKPSPGELRYINDPVGMLGPWMLSASLCLLLEGIAVCQLTNYIINYHRTDRWLTKLMVYATMLLVSAKAGQIMYIAWTFFVADFGNYLLASLPTTSIKIMAVEASITGAVVQSFFIHRTFTFSKSWIFLVLTVPPLILGVVGSIIVTVIVFNIPLLLKSTKLINAAANMMVSCVVICDVFITAFTAYYLLKTKTGFKETNSMITRLISTAIQSALPPTTCAIVNLALNSQAKKNAWVNLFNNMMPFLYAMSMLFTLNARASIRRGTGTPFSSNVGAYELNSSSKPASRSTRPEVYISQQRHVDTLDSPYMSSKAGSDPESKPNVLSLHDDFENDAVPRHYKSNRDST